MDKTSTENFWTSSDTALTIERRVVWKFGARLGELTVSIAPNQPVTPLSRMSETMIAAATVGARGLSKDAPVVPQLVYAEIKDVAGQAVAASGNIDIPILQLTTKNNLPTDLTIEAQMAAARSAMPTAAVAPGDHAVGWLVKDDVLHFYPLLAVTIPEDIESYDEGSASTSDVIPMLPFQS